MIFHSFRWNAQFFLARHILWIWLIVHLCCWFFYTNNRWSHVGIEENCHYLLIFIFSNRDKIQFFRQKWNHGVQNWITELFVWRNEMFKFSRTWIKNIIVRRALQWKINIAWSLHVSHSLIILKKHRIKKKKHVNQSSIFRTRLKQWE